jgi:hypothetical protein
MDPTTGLCAVFEHSYDCLEKAAQTNKVTNCGSQKYCTGGVCYDAGYPPDQDFAKSVSTLEAAREAGRYMDKIDVNNIKIFGGVDSRCVRKLGGLINCCASGGFAELMSDLKAGADKLKDLGQDVQNGPSDYVADSLFSDQAPSWVNNGMRLIGVKLALDVGTDVMKFMQSLGNMAWDLVSQFITLFGLFSCADPNKVTVMRKGQGLCHYVDDYCSDSFLGICFARKQTYCCYNSKLARIINEQARKTIPPATGPQIAKGWGSATSPDCSGFSPEQLASLDFSKFDLSEFYDSITSSGSKPIISSIPTGGAKGSIGNCTANGGPCQKPDLTLTCNPGDTLSGSSCISAGGGSYPAYPASPVAKTPYDPTTAGGIDPKTGKPMPDPACTYSKPGYVRPARCG